MIFFWILIALIIFSFVILTHEWWHFFAARNFWVKVEEFWLWIPPRAKKLFIDKKWTLFSLNWIPLWGFVRLYGENLWLENKKINKKSEENKKFSNKNYIQKSIILLAWIFMNFILAIFIFSILFFIWVKPIWINTQIKTNLNLKLIPNYEQAINEWILIKNPWIILNPLPWSIAEKSNIRKWDIILEVATCKYKMLDYWFCWDKNWNIIGKLPKTIKINNILDLKNILNKNKWKKISIYWIWKQSLKTWENDFYELKIPKNWKIWAYIWENIAINKNFKYKYSLLNSLKFWTLETYNQVLFTFKWIWILGQKIFNPKKPEERKKALNQMSWPIWIVDFISNSYKQWIIFLFLITAIISINLWVFNLLPIPALDWWRWFLLTINTLIKKLSKNKFSIQNFENFLHIIFFIILIALSILIWYNDIEKIINK